jgi:uncharacterized membrane protein
MAIQQTKQALAPERAQQPRAESGEQARGLQYQYRDGHGRKRSSGSSGEGLATFLGWFSIGLGLAEVFAPRQLSKLIGLNEDHTLLLRAMGLREITSGIGILSTTRPTGWVWSRVAGDALDLSLLGAALASDDSDKGRVWAATGAVAGVTALDVICAEQLRSGLSDRATVVEAVTIDRPADELYRFWHNFENLPRFMNNLESVRVTGERRSHWVAKGPAGTPVEWDAEILEDRPNELISWRSLEGSEVENSGTVRFKPAPGNRGTEVQVELEYNPPGGLLGAGVAKIFGSAPEQLIKGDLSRFKQLMETGEVVHSDASIHRGLHPAQPPEDNTASFGKEEK